MFPKLIVTSAGGAADILPRVPLASGERNEAWLRDLLLRCPEALPAAELDEAFAEPIPVCRELSTPAGPIDALFVNRHGALTLVECKLWRNPQARREVVGQILDYAKELARFRYEDLQREVSRATGMKGNALFQLVSSREGGVFEAPFVDAVTRNLRRGRFLLLVVGDGIREGTEAIVEFMQTHSGLHFTFGLVEMAGYELPDGALVVQPRILARSVTIERRLVRVVESDGAEIPIADEDLSASEDQVKRRRVDPALVDADRQFWQRFIDELIFDDPSQPKPVRNGRNSVRYNLGIRGIVMGSWRTRSESTISTYITFGGETAQTLFPPFERDAAAITAMLQAISPESWIEWDVSPSGARWVAMRRNVPEPWDARCEKQQIAWFTVVANAFLNIFKPKLRRLQEERDQVGVD